MGTLFSGKWFDPVIGIDIHLIQPPGPVPPIPVPHPFIGIVYDPMSVVVGMAISAATSGLFGGSFSGPVLINGMPAANTGMQVKGRPVHIPIGGTFVNPPSNEGTIITGSKTVHISGTSGARLTSMVITCNDPVNLPTSVVMSIPMGAPVFTGGPTAVDWMAVALSAIRTKWVSDKLHGIFKAKPGSWRSKIICFLTGHPVDVATGRVLTGYLDFQLPGPSRFRFERNYYSASTYEGPLGFGWHHSYDQHVRAEDGRIILHSEDGRDIEFDDIEEGHTVFEPVERLSLERTHLGFNLCPNDGRTLRFGPERNASGAYLLSRIVDRFGNAVTLQYAAGRLISVKDCVGRVIEFLNDKFGRLIAVKVPGPDQSNRAVIVARFEYDDAGDLVAAYDALDNIYRYAYRNHRLIADTNRNGITFHFEYDSYAPDGRCVRTWGDEGIFARKLTYYPEAHVTVVEDSLGAKTTYLSNDAGLVTKVVDAAGAQTSYEWNESCQKISETDADGNTAKWVYDESGRCIRHTNPLGDTLEEKFDGLGRGFEIVDFRGNTWQRKYDGMSRLIGTVDPAGFQWQFARDSAGRLQQVTDPLGAFLRYDYDRDGLLIGHTDWNGGKTSYEVDRWGRPVIRRDALGRKTHFGYDHLGRLILVIRADGKAVDAEYDAEGNLTRVASDDGRATLFRYGHLNCLLEQTNALGATRRYQYNSEGQLVSIQNENGETWHAERDASGRVVREIDFTGNEIVYQRDFKGRATSIRNVGGQTSTLQYDAIGRLVRQNWSDGSTRALAYDPNGGLIEAVSETSHVSYIRDSLGRVIEEKQDDHWVRSTYDAVGNRIRRQTSVGDDVLYQYGRNRNLESLKFDAGKSLQFKQEPSGTKITQLQPGGARLVEEYDELGRLIHQRATVPELPWLRTQRDNASHTPASVLAERRYKYEGFGHVRSMEDIHWGVTEYRHDPLGRLVSRTDSGQYNELYVYDNCGNVVTATRQSERESTPEVRTFTYGAGSQLLATGATSLQYGPDGFLLQKIVGQGSPCTWNFQWLGGRLGSVKTPQGAEWAYKYDALGRRLLKSGPGVRIRYIWDGDCVSVVSQMGCEPVTWIFDPKQLSPLAQVEGGKVRSFVTDHLGTPRELIDDEGALVWAGRMQTWGGEIESRPDQTDCPVRFKGQWWDAETTLTYNRFRYYDSTQLRFISPDPARLAGGLNFYSYVQNPTASVDPYGLQSREDMLASALDVLKSYDQEIKEVFGQDAQYGVRGSLSTGTRYSSGLPFDPSNFDVDAFIVSKDLPTGFSHDVMPNSFDVHALEEAIEGDLRNIPGFEGLREGPFGFKNFKREQPGSTFACK